MSYLTARLLISIIFVIGGAYVAINHPDLRVEAVAVIASTVGYWIGGRDRNGSGTNQNGEK